MTTETTADAPAVPRPSLARVCACTALVLIPVNGGVWLAAVRFAPRQLLPWFVLFTALAVVQLVSGVVALVAGIRAQRAGRCGIAPALLGAFASVGAVAGWLGGAFLGALARGGGWGRPLRVRGRQLHPELCEGSDWTAGERPDASALDDATRRALEALWLHDAQKEHASVPAFARVSWLLAAAGAPAELLAWSHRAALEEIEHAQLCFALAAGYGGRTHTVEPLPELLAGGLDVQDDALELLAVESLCDGCQLEDFNADVAAECARACEEPVTRAGLERIAREERSHAELSWAIVRWVLGRAPASMAPALERALPRLDRYRRPTAVSAAKLALVARADPAELRRHGRIPDGRWAELWRERLAATRGRARELLDVARHACAPSRTAEAAALEAS